jgi:ParB-like chromosome segregation protein Spo0J
MKVHNINNLPTIPIADLLPTQGNLKDLSEVNYKKLKSTIERRGFSYPVYVWESQDGLLHLLDGHQRQRVLTTEGWNEPIPYLKVPAKDLQEAMARLLEITSQYATITQEGIDEFIATYELNEAEVYEATSFDATRFQKNDDFNPEFDESENDNDLKTKDKVICPDCGLEFTP